MKYKIVFTAGIFIIVALSLCIYFIHSTPYLTLFEIRQDLSQGHTKSLRNLVDKDHLSAHAIKTITHQIKSIKDQNFSIMNQGFIVMIMPQLINHALDKVAKQFHPNPQPIYQNVPLPNDLLGDIRFNIIEVESQNSIFNPNYFIKIGHPDNQIILNLKKQTNGWKISQF